VKPSLIVAAQAASGAGVLGVPALVLVLLASDAGAPIPFPTDVLLIVLGERAGAGAVPLWLAVLAVEFVAVVSTAALFVVCRGPGYRLVSRFGRLIGLTEDRLARAHAVVERRGRVGLALGRATPGLRTITVIAAGGSGLRLRRALLPLALGSTVFLQLHLILGYVIGPEAREAIAALTRPFLIVVVALAGAAATVWFIGRRRSRANDGPALWHEGVCPACLAAAIVERRSEPQDDSAAGSATPLGDF
jgi:membrane protein DedA with SNARE-associated domain